MDPLNPGGLAGLALQVHRIGLRVRDRLSVDNWRAINALIETLGLGRRRTPFRCHRATGRAGTSGGRPGAWPAP